MKIFLIIALCFIQGFDNEKIRTFEYKGSKVNTTFDVDKRFIGKYKGKKSGYLVLNEDGTGQYKYDIFAFGLKGCKPDPIDLEWGFLYDEGKVVSFKREYGLSYPILLKSTSETSFKGCREKIILDFIIQDNNEPLEVSSSDDWVKS